MNSGDNAMIRRIRHWITGNDGVAGIELAILFPVLLSILMALYDLGQGIIINHKTINASQIMGDLITRQQTVSMAEIADIVNAAEMALDPYETTTLGYDIISVSFDDASLPVTEWRVTSNMTPNADALNSLENLADPDEGLVIVTVAYQYTPFFTDFIIDQFDMQEVSFLRGRRSAIVSCTDCPGGA
jgi:Flp pilus assembly protein TadG